VLVDGRTELRPLRLPTDPLGLTPVCDAEPFDEDPPSVPEFPPPDAADGGGATAATVRTFLTERFA
jgi:hypothetical protein